MTMSLVARDVALRAIRLCKGECHRDSSRAPSTAALKAETLSLDHKLVDHVDRRGGAHQVAPRWPYRRWMNANRRSDGFEIGTGRVRGSGSTRQITSPVFDGQHPEPGADFLDDDAIVFVALAGAHARLQNVGINLEERQLPEWA